MVSCHISAVIIVCRLNKYINTVNIKEVLAILNQMKDSESPLVRNAVALNLKVSSIKLVPSQEHPQSPK